MTIWVDCNFLQTNSWEFKRNYKNKWTNENKLCHNHNTSQYLISIWCFHSIYKLFPKTTSKYTNRIYNYYNENIFPLLLNFRTFGIHPSEDDFFVNNNLLLYFSVQYSQLSCMSIKINCYIFYRMIAYACSTRVCSELLIVILLNLYSYWITISLHLYMF